MSAPTESVSSKPAPPTTSTGNSTAAMSTQGPKQDAPAGDAPSDRKDHHDNHRDQRNKGRGGRGGPGGRGGRAGRGGRGGRGDSRGGRPGRRPVNNRQRRDDRPTDGDDDEASLEKRRTKMHIPFSAEEIAAEDRRPKKKVAVLIGYAGTGYKGMQINHHEKTIEGDLFGAFVAAGAIQKRNADDPKKSSFVRCARTDKGVHAAGNVISLKLTIEDADIVEKINEKLPDQIRVWGIQRTNNAFNCYQACDSRWYEYLLPSYTLLPPHPQTFLGGKVIESAKAKGVYEDCMKAWDDVKDFWEEVERNDIKPILDNLDEKTREEVLKLIHTSESPSGNATDEDASLENTQEKKPEAESSKRKAEDSVDDTVTKKLRSEDGQAPEAQGEGNIKAAGDKNFPTENGEGPGVTNTVPEETEEDAAIPQVEAGEAMVIDEKPTEPAPAADGLADIQNAAPVEKPKYQPTPVEIALKEVKSAYIAAKRRYRVTTARVQQLQAALDMYVGTNNFHNYTIQKTFKDPSAKRHIRSFVVNPKPIQIGDTEWLSLKVHGQSFMMHQIRKMVAMAALSVRCAMPLDRIRQSYGPTRISIPKAPGLGLLLERPVFESYSKKATGSFGYEALNFDKHDEKIEEFKHRMIYKRIWDTEEKEASFHVFLHQLDSFNTDYFLWLTAGGFDAAYEPKERFDPKQKPRLLGAKEEVLVGDDEDAEDGADGAGDEG